MKHYIFRLLENGLLLLEILYLLSHLPNSKKDKYMYLLCSNHNLHSSLPNLQKLYSKLKMLICFSFLLLFFQLHLQQRLDALFIPELDRFEHLIVGNLRGADFDHVDAVGVTRKQKVEI